MRIHTVHLEISGITRVVINRQIVWELGPSCDGPEVWRKTAGGPGFDELEAAGTRRATLFPHEMKKLIDRLMEKHVVIRKWKGHDVCTEQYRAWVSGNTLNIVQRSPEEWS
jgi:hypothetical protein